MKDRVTKQSKWVTRDVYMLHGVILAALLVQTPLRKPREHRQLNEGSLQGRGLPDPEVRFIPEWVSLHVYGGEEKGLSLCFLF